MTHRPRKCSVDMRDPKNWDGLHQRLAEKRNAAIGRTTLLPLCSFPQVPDKTKGSK